MHLPGALWLLLWAMALPSPAPGEPTYCTRVRESGLRSGATSILAEATSAWDTVQADADPYVDGWVDRLVGPIYVVDGDTLNKAAFALADSIASFPLPAQRFRVLRVGPGTGPDIIEGQELSIVPWGVTPACAYRPHRWTTWVTPGDTVAFQLQATRAHSPVVFDVQTSDNPYPSYPLAYRTWGGDLPHRQTDRRWVSPHQYFEFLGLFRRPAVDLTPQRLDSLRSRILEWARLNSVEQMAPVSDWLPRTGDSRHPVGASAANAFGAVAASWRGALRAVKALNRVHSP